MSLKLLIPISFISIFGCSNYPVELEVTCQRFTEPQDIDTDVITQKAIGVGIYYWAKRLSPELDFCIPTNHKYQIGLEARF